jgi:hypothetical protein
VIANDRPLSEQSPDQASAEGEQPIAEEEAAADD